MRGALIAILIVGSLPAIIVRPYLGVLVYSWFSYMNPHQLAWGFFTTLPWAMILGVVTFGAWVLSRENKKYPATPLTIAIVLFVVWCTITTTQAYVGAEAWDYWLRYIKIMSMIFLTLILFQDRKRLVWLVWVIVVSIGFYGVKGGVAGYLLGGDFTLWGPQGSFIADNNALAMALVMLLPFVRFLQLETTDRRIRMALLASMPFLLLSILISYSRGGFLGLSAMLFFLAMKSKNRLGYGILIVIALVGALSMMPDRYFDRLNTIETEAGRGTASPRIASWYFAMDVAAANPLFGGGFEFFDSIPLVVKYAEPAAIQGWTPQGPVGRNMHSIYFQVLGTQGYIGLALFLFILISAYYNCSKVRRLTKSRPDLAWVNNLSSMVQASIVGMCTAGAFQNLAFFDLTWHVISIAALARIVAERELAKPAPAPESAAPESATPRGAHGRPFPKPALAPSPRGFQAPRTPVPRQR